LNQRRSRHFVRATVVALALAAAANVVPVRAPAALSGPQLGVLQQYLTALRAGRYDRAFALLTDPERRYFGNATNYASVYAADRLSIMSFRVLASTTEPKRGTVALVSERIGFFDQAHQVAGTATAKVAYGILPSRGGPRIKDPYHPWRAFAPAGLAVTNSGVRASVRKISFYTGRLEVVVTFANLGDATVTLLPYGRSVVRDDRGKAYTPVATRLPGLTDKTLFTGLRLAGSGQYTGLMTFLTPDRFAPKTLTITFAPALLDGGDAPFDLALPAYTLPG
jgi:hypothetical protein